MEKSIHPTESFSIFPIGKGERVWTGVMLGNIAALSLCSKLLTLSFVLTHITKISHAAAHTLTPNYSCPNADLCSLCLWAESGLWDHPDAWPGIWGGLSAGSTGQERWPRLVHTAWEFRQQTIQTHPQTTLQHPQICKCSAHALTHTGSSCSSVPLQFSTSRFLCYRCGFREAFCFLNLDLSLMILHLKIDTVLFRHFNALLCATMLGVYV